MTRRAYFIRTVKARIYWRAAKSWMIYFTKPLPFPYRSDIWEGHVIRGRRIAKTEIGK